MCERFALHSDITAVRARFRVRGASPFERKPSWDVRARDRVPVIRAGKNGRREMALLEWGLAIDYHLLDTAKGPATQIPARSLKRAALLQALFETQRCILPADAFYVTPAFLPKTKHAPRPWAFALDDDSVMGIAALWVPDPHGRSAGSVAIIATSPNESVALLSETMPAILFPEDEREWLSHATDPYAAYNIIKPFPAEMMRAWPVAPLEGERAGDGPDLLARVA